MKHFQSYQLFPSIKNIKDTILKKEGTYFTKIDLKNGYFHLNLANSFKRYVCFKYKDKFYNFNKLPFGLSTATAMFQRFTSYQLSGRLPNNGQDI